MSKIRPPEEVAEHLLRIVLARPPDAELLDGVTSAEVLGVATRVLCDDACPSCGDEFGRSRECDVCWVAREWWSNEPRTIEEWEQIRDAERARRAACSKADHASEPEHSK